MTQWIPVTERLPEEVEICLVTTKASDGLNEVGIGWYSPTFKNWRDMDDNKIKVLAWMPLPEPFEEYPVEATEDTQKREST